MSATTTGTYSFGTPPEPVPALAPQSPEGLALRRPSRAAFHTLPVLAVEPLADDSITLTVAVPPELAGEYAFTAGQHLTFRAEVEGHAVRRSYSICDPAPPEGGPATLRVGIKRLADGAFSGWVHEKLQPGDEIDVMTPQGYFTAVPDPDAERRYVAIAAGSGITPVLSLVSTLLRDEPHSEVTLLYGNRRTSSVMFLEELADLKDRHPDRFELLHVLSREAQDVDLLTGRLEPGRVEALLEAFVDVPTVDGWYLCGPFAMVTGIRELLAKRGVPATDVHTELFYVEDTPPVVRTREEEQQDAAEAEVVVSLDGRTSTVRMPSRAQNILAAVRQVRAEAPFSCTNGVCGTCRARLVEGEVRMDHNYALEPDEVERGVVLTCQSHPVTDRVVLDYDA